MYDFVLMHVTDRQCQLCEHTQDPLLTYIYFLCAILFNHPSQITSVCIVHHDTQLSRCILVDLSEVYDVGMAQHAHKLCFSVCRLQLCR